MDNIILIGMPGVGKSTLGVLLAKTLGMTFLDTDLVIQELYEERVPLYEQYAHLTIDCSGQDVEHTLDRVMRALEKRGQG